MKQLPVLISQGSPLRTLATAKPSTVYCNNSILLLSHKLLRLQFALRALKWAAHYPAVPLALFAPQFFARYGYLFR